MTNTGVSGENFRGSLQVQKNAPSGEGYGYRASIDTQEGKKGYVTIFRPYFQYNGPYGTYSTQFSTQFGAGESYQTYQFNASGAIVYVGRTFGFSRPVNDSFAIVKVGEVRGVRVYHNNQEIGRTDRFGKMVLPTFHSYDANQVRINDRDIPLQYTLSGVTRLVSPPFRSGTLISFGAQKVQAFTGLLKGIKEGKKLPLEFCPLTLQVNGKTIRFQTGRDGEFFIEDAEPGSHSAQVRYQGKAYSLILHIPASQELIIDGGEIHVPLD